MSRFLSTRLIADDSVTQDKESTATCVSVEVLKMASWKEIARNAQTHRDTTVEAVDPPLPGLPSNLSHNVIDVPRQILSQQEIQITETPVLTLVEQLATKNLTATTVTNAFLRRAAVAQKLVHTCSNLAATQSD